MQKLLVLVCAVTIVQSRVIENETEVKNDCDGIIIDDVYHDIEVLKSDIDRPYLLNVDYSTNTLYFSYSLNSKDDGFRTAYMNLNTREYGELEDVVNGFAQAVDQNNHEIYIGGSDGIYKYNHKTKKGEHIGAKNTDIWYLYFKDILYYSDFPGQFLNTLINGESSKFKDLEDTKVDQFVINNEDLIFFKNETGIYSQKKGTKDATLFKDDINKDVRGITTDVNGNVFFCFSDGIYKVVKSEESVKKIVDVDDAFGLAFDNENNIVYSDATALYRLKPNNSKNC